VKERERVIECSKGGVFVRVDDGASGGVGDPLAQFNAT